MDLYASPRTSAGMACLRSPAHRHLEPANHWKSLASRQRVPSKSSEPALKSPSTSQPSTHQLQFPRGTKRPNLTSPSRSDQRRARLCELTRPASLVRDPQGFSLTHSCCEVVGLNSAPCAPAHLWRAKNRGPRICLRPKEEGGYFGSLVMVRLSI
jgi:hypothetical protein